MRLSNFSSADESKVNMHDSLPPKIESDDENDFCNTGYNVTEASRVMTKAPLSSENDTIPESASRRTEKQTLRDQIKGMLLCAGWKIEMKRRKGKKYEDSVYVSPEGIGYWSITKAYGVLKEQINKIDELGNKKGKGYYQFSVIPTDMLGILKRKIVKNRRFIGAEKFVGSKKTKCVTSSKSAKIKKVVAVKKEINENGIVGSSRKKNKNRRGCALLARNANQETDSEGDNYVPYAGRRSVLAWLLDSGTVPLNGKVKYMNKRRTWVMLEGLVTRDGILCKCCSKTLTVSKFEIHAGSKQKQPYENIFLEGLGISLLECQLDAWKKQEESKRCPSHLVRVTDEDPNDDTCGICGDGGNLICCDSCPATFHLSCLGIQTPPPGDWHCMNCLCRFCGRADSNTSDGHSLTGSLLLSCGQCGEKYHQVCMPDLDAAPVNTNHLGLSFCGQSCRMLFEQLQNLIGIKNDLEGGFSWTLLAQRVECNSKIAVALSVMDECFLPILDQRSGINLITNVLYNCGSNFSRLDYQGFYTFILEQGDEILSAASIRIHGKRLAEMPFIGTRHIYRRQGMCRRLLNAIEEALGSLKIEKLVIPAISELMHTWTVAFGFEPLSDSDMQEIRNMNMLVFPAQVCCRSIFPVLNDASLVPDESSAAHDPGEVKDETVVNESGFSELHGSAQTTAKVSYQLSDPSCDAPCRSGAGEIGLKPLETAPDGESSIQCDTDSRDEENGKCTSCVVPSTEPETEDPACGAVEIRSQVNGHLPGAYPVDTPVLPCSPVVSGAAVLNNKPWNDRDLPEHRPEGSCGSAPVLHNPTVSDMHMMHGICSKKEEGCTLADSAPGADCWA
ncbi:unnamed protein product [Spirodela intermedia]|uniref:PHD-type domain-containing protein n=1 Tax=Spirodela intermedia TaxID=51605 RepID=A0A7I8INJ6_SPIIN|nr:unnamed protein product [Spirodela intermedia]CAA6658557.1 unnamed protein product [Spirodela intermedia]